MSVIFRFTCILIVTHCVNGDPPKLDGKIIGGQSVNIESHPYMVSLHYYHVLHICGGSIISERHIITAAHCTNRKAAYQLSVRAGSTTNDMFDGIIYGVKSVMANPKYNPKTMDFDVAILTLYSKLRFSHKILPIPLLTANEPKNGTYATVTGWGVLSESGGFPRRLQMVQVEIVARSKCQESFGQSNITDNMICAGSWTGGKDACQGDSGGPLVYKGKLLGIVSWGYGCGRPKYPGVYTSIPKVYDFIESNFKHILCN